VTGWLSVWSRWLWCPLILIVASGALRRQFRGADWLLAGSALALLAYFVVQGAGVMEGRYRKPLEPLIVAAAVVLGYRSRRSPDRVET
jgi:hypothetical protein